MTVEKSKIKAITPTNHNRTKQRNDAQLFVIRSKRGKNHAPAAVNFLFFAFALKPFVPSKRKCTSPILYNVTNLE